MGRCCGVPIVLLPEVWPKVEGYLAKSLKVDECGRYWPVDVFQLLLEGRGSLWVAYDSEHGFIAAAVSEVIQWPRMRECRVWLTGGKMLKLWQEEMRLMIEGYAKSSGCQYITGSGRKGWIRMPGYREGGVNFQKAL
jgi:hypothetical protein